MVLKSKYDSVPNTIHICVKIGELSSYNVSYAHAHLLRGKSEWDGNGKGKKLMQGFVNKTSQSTWSWVTMVINCKRDLIRTNWFTNNGFQSDH